MPSSLDIILTGKIIFIVVVLILIILMFKKEIKEYFKKIKEEGLDIEEVEKNEQQNNSIE